MVFTYTCACETQHPRAGEQGADVVLRVSIRRAHKQKHGFKASPKEIVFWIKQQAEHQKNVIAYFNSSDARRNRFVVMDVAGVCAFFLSLPLPARATRGGQPLPRRQCERRPTATEKRRGGCFPR
jgi:hypothetical protein